MTMKTPSRFNDDSLTPGRGRQRGSALILALVTVVMLLMLGAAYLQVARTDRRTAAAVDTRTNVSDASILRYIGGILAGDVPSEIDGQGPEGYDHPHSSLPTGGDPGVNGRNGPSGPIPAGNNGWWVVDDRFAPTVVPGPIPNIAPTGANDLPDQPAREPRAGGGVADAAGNYHAEGGRDDDTWLASTEPDAATGYWPHITNLSGVFLDLSNIVIANDTSTGTRPMPAQYLSTTIDTTITPVAPVTTMPEKASGDTYAVPAVSMATLAGADRGLFADADGDGIADSRWTWAPLPSDGGNAYVIAVRIVDHSSMVDINTWAFDGPGGSGTSTDESRWLWPGELDLGEAMGGVVIDAVTGGGGTAGTFTANNVLTSADPNGRNLGGADFLDNRLYNWLDASAVWRGVNGANNLDDWDEIGTKMERDGTLPGVEDPMDPGRDYSRFNLRLNEIELRWRNGLNRADDNVNPNASTPLEGLDATLLRAATAPPAETTFSDTPYNTPAPFMFNEPRKQITTISGSADAGRVNLNSQTIARLADAFEDPLKATNRPQVMVNLGFNETSAAGRKRFGEAMAVLVADFKDQNLELEALADGGDTSYGMEHLPFISEILVEARYQIAGVVTDKGDSDTNGENEYDFGWEFTDAVNPGNDVTAFIELVNPWPHPIRVPEVRIEVDGDLIPENLQQLLGPAKTTLDGGEMICIPINAATANYTPPNVATGGAVTAFDWPADDTTTATNDTDYNEIEVNLLVPASDGTDVLYQRFRSVEPVLPPFEIDREIAGAPPAVATGDDGYERYTTRTTGNGFSVTAVLANDAAGTNEISIEERHTDQPQVAIGNPTGTLTTDTFDVAIKNATPVAFDNRVTNANNEPWLIGNAGRFYRTGELLRMVLIAPRNQGGTPVSIAEVWQEIFDETGGYDIADAMFDMTFDPTTTPMPAADAPKLVGSGRLAINFAQYYLAKFTTLEVNNDTGGLVAGRPNINTMPERHIARMLPTLNQTDADDIAELIVEQRSAKTGIAFPAELAFVDPAITPAALRTTVYDPAGNTSAAVVDFNEVEHATAGLGGPAAHAADGRTNDIEERTMLLNYLNQVVSTRSDIFTAYVLVRSYPASDFSQNGDNDLPPDGVFDPTDEFRLIAIFDRSSVVGGIPRILAVKRFED